MFLRVCSVVFVICSLAPNVLADDLSSTLGSPLREVSHDVEVAIVDGHARYTVTRVFANLGERPDEASLNLELPFSAAAVGLKIKARERWYDAELLRAEEARRKYNELTGLGRHQLKDPAILEWRWNDSLFLQVFPVIQQQTSTVQYTLVAPTEYKDGRYTISYPRHDGNPLMAIPTIRFKSKENVWLEGIPIAPNQPVTLAEDQRATKCVRLGFAEHCVAIRVPVLKKETVKKLIVSLEFDHSYLSDLSLHLVDPQGTMINVAPLDAEAWKKPIEIKFNDGQSLEGEWHVVFRDNVGLDRGTVRGVTLSTEKGGRVGRGQDLPLVIPDHPDDGNVGSFAMMQIERSKPNDTALRFAKLAIPNTKNYITRVELDVAKKLSRLPVKPRYVFLVDASHSMGESGVDAQLDVIRSMLHHVPDATFEIVRFNRFAYRVFGDFKPVDELRSLPAIPRGNGSSLDSALELTQGILETERSSTPTYVVAMSDMRMRHAFVEDDVSDQFKANATVHIVDVPRSGGGHISIERNDDMLLASLATKKGGIAVQSGGFPIRDSKEKQVAARALTEHLVRPIKVEHFAVNGVAMDVDNEMFEGGSIREIFDSTDTKGRVNFTGKLWSKNIRWTATSKRPYEKLAAAWFITHGHWSSLDDEQTYKLGMFANAVTPQTSFLAVEPGVRPSTFGIERPGFGGRGFGSARIRSGAMVVRPVLKWEKFLRPVAQRCAKKHRPQSTSQVSLSIDVTGEEIVDVGAASMATTPATKDDHAFASCLQDGVWSVRLDNDGYGDRLHQVMVPASWSR